MDKFSAEDLFKSALEREATGYETITEALIEKIGFTPARAEEIAKEASLSYMVLIKATLKDFQEQFSDPVERNMVFALFTACLLEWAKEMEPMATYCTQMAMLFNRLEGGNNG